MKPPDAIDVRLPDLPPAVSTGIPFVLFGVLLVVGASTYGSDFYVTFIRSEAGVIENGTALLALMVAGAAVLALRTSHVMAPSWFFRGWLGFFVLGGLFLAGEEISWGQHVFHWASPQYFRDTNIQGETNLHNLTHLSEIIPKFLLHTAAIVGGIIWPLVAGRGRVPAPRAPEFFYWLMPTRAVLWAASIAIAIRVIERILANSGLKAQGFALNEYKEVNELFLVLFVLFYLASLTVRARAYAALQGAAEPLPGSGDPAGARDAAQ